MHFFFPKEEEKGRYRMDCLAVKKFIFERNKASAKTETSSLRSKGSMAASSRSVFIKCRIGTAVSPSMAEKSELFMPHTNSLVDTIKIKCALSLIVKRIPTINSQCARRRSTLSKQQQSY